MQLSDACANILNQLSDIVRQLDEKMNARIITFVREWIDDYASQDPRGYREQYMSDPANRERVRKQQREWYIRNRQHVIAKTAEWKRKNRGRNTN